jgi:two-component system, sensor histidine kinase and response regulator
MSSAEASADPCPNWRNEYQTALDRLGGDEELFLDLAQMCLEDAVQLKADALAALAADEPDTAARAIHSLKGLAANFDERELTTLLDRAERLALVGELPTCERELEQAEPRMAALAAELQRILNLERPA